MGSSATQRPAPRLYLIAPPFEDASAFAAFLGPVLEAGDVAALLVQPATADHQIAHDYVRILGPIVQGRGIALLLDGTPETAARVGADGAHLRGIDELAAGLRVLKPQRIAGAGGLKSRHEAMLAGEMEADYVMFGDPDSSGWRPAFDAVLERVAWWTELFEVPCVGFAAGLGEIAALTTAGADFVAVGDAIWATDAGPVAGLGLAMRELRASEPAR